MTVHPSAHTPSRERNAQKLPWRTMGCAALSLGLGVLLAYGLRHGLVEPAEFTHRCEASPDSSALCSLRSWTVAAFVHQRLAWAALVLAVFSWVMCCSVKPRVRSSHLHIWACRSAARFTCLGALFLGGAGLVLYVADVASLAVLIALQVALNLFVPIPASVAEPMTASHP